MKQKIYITLVFLIGIVIHSCEKDPMLAYGISSFNKTIYHKNEVFRDSLTKLYGRWKLYDISGGLGGSGTDNFTFNELEFQPYGIYGFYDNGFLFEYGSIILKPSMTVGTDWTFQFNKDANARRIAIYRSQDQEYTVKLINDTLSIYPYRSFDDFNYHFSRVVQP